MHQSMEIEQIFTQTCK